MSQLTFLDEKVLRDESLIAEIVHDRTNVQGVKHRFVHEEMKHRPPEVFVLERPAQPGGGNGTCQHLGATKPTHLPPT